MTRFAATCLEFGCTNHIYYTDEDIERPYYCEKHRTETDRHSQVKILKKPTPKTMRVCLSHNSIRSDTVLKCPLCNRDMVEL